MSEEVKEEVQEPPKKEAEIAGRTIRLGLSVKDCKDRGVRPSAFKAELNNPIFDDWDFLLRIVNMGIVKGDPFTEDDSAFWTVTSSILVLVGDPTQNKSFLAHSSESSDEKPPSS